MKIMGYKNNTKNNLFVQPLTYNILIPFHCQTIVVGAILYYVMYPVKCISCIRICWLPKFVNRKMFLCMS